MRMDIVFTHILRQKFGKTISTGRLPQIFWEEDYERLANANSPIASSSQLYDICMELLSNKQTNKQTNKIIVIKSFSKGGKLIHREIYSHTISNSRVDCESVDHYTFFMTECSKRIFPMIRSHSTFTDCGWWIESLPSQKIQFSILIELYLHQTEDHCSRVQQYHWYTFLLNKEVMKIRIHSLISRNSKRTCVWGIRNETRNSPAGTSRRNLSIFVLLFEKKYAASGRGRELINSSTSSKVYKWQEIFISIGQ
jgi:hypothetical protein